VTAETLIMTLRTPGKFLYLQEPLQIQSGHYHSLGLNPCGTILEIRCFVFPQAGAKYDAKVSRGILADLILAPGWQVAET
jgi:hypothetical protein